MPSFIGSSTAAPSASSATSFTTQQTPAQVGAQVGDVLIAIGGHERTTQPTLGGISGLTVARATVGSELAEVIAWKRLAAGDLDTAVTMSTAGSTRRGMVAFQVHRSAVDPTFTAGAEAGGTSSQTTAVFPDVTPTGSGATVVSLGLFMSNVTPYDRTFSPASGWTETFEAGSASTTGPNAFVYSARRSDTTGGTSVPGNVVTASAPQFKYLPTTVVLEHAAPLALSVTGGGSVAAGSTQTITATASGGTTPRTVSIAQRTGPTRALTRSGDAWSFTAPRTAGGASLSFRVTATDNAGATTSPQDVTYTVAADPDVVDQGTGGGDGWPDWLPRIPGQAQVHVLTGDGTYTPPVTDPVEQTALRAAFLDATPTGTRQRYVAPTGSDTAAGTSSAPFATIGRAVADAQPGDQVLVRPGEYGYTRIQGRHGTPTAWITVMPEFPGDKVTVRVPAANTGTYEAVTLIDSDYVAVLGLDVAGSGALGVDDANADRSGVAIYGGVHHARVWGCHIHDLPGGGINAFCWEESYGGNGLAFDLLDLSYNTIHGTSRRSPSNTSGISINAAQDLTSGATWGDGTGIRVVGNHIYDVQCLVPFTPGGYDIVTDGNGISVDLTWDQYDYAKRQLVQDNLVHGCGARAVHCYGAVNTDVFHNTVFGNLINSTDSSAIAGDPEIDAEDGYIKTRTSTERASVRFHGNVILPTRYGVWRDGVSTYTSNLVLAGTQAVDGTNIDRRATGTAYMPGLASDPSRFIPAARLEAPSPVTVTSPTGALPTTRRTGSTWVVGGLPAPVTPPAATTSSTYSTATYSTATYND